MANIVSVLVPVPALQLLFPAETQSKPQTLGTVLRTRRNQMTMKELIRPKDLELVMQFTRVPDNIATGELMRKARIQRGISLRELAKRLKWSAAYVSDCERGHRLWTDKKVEQFATALGYRNNGVNQ